MIPPEARTRSTITRAFPTSAGIVSQIKWHVVIVEGESKDLIRGNARGVCRQL